MGKKDKYRGKEKHRDKKEGHDKGKKKKVKEKCCEKYLRKNKHCKGCPMLEKCALPERK